MRWLVSIGVLGCAIALTFYLYANKPKSAKVRPKRPVPVVQVSELVKSDQPITVHTYGTVIPAQKLQLTSEVEGNIIKIHPEMVPGGIIRQGEILLQIDPTDYQLRVTQSRAEVASAQYELELEKGQQLIAAQEWKLLEADITPTARGKALALRKPHLELAQAKLQAARSRLEMAELDVKRTLIQAPFNTLVLDKSIELGQLATRQHSMATLVNTDHFWVQVSIPVTQLPKISLPNINNPAGSHTEIIIDHENRELQRYRGTLFKLLGNLDPKGRMARLLIRVDDPLALISTQSTSSQADNKLLLGSYVKANISAGTLKDVYSIPRQALRDDNTIWFVDEKSQLIIHPVEVAWRLPESLLVRTKIPAKTQLITSRLQSPLPGMTVAINTISDSRKRGNNRANPNEDQR